MECHLESGWLLIYRINEGKLILFASGAGTHAYLSASEPLLCG
ncbi:MAG: type II toxin-antitoxin system YafQ family toxin [Coriobacteriales bacterium]|nr:type II toxin-antitoxin system YafQ family toxin [Coriobacteriales bacterium]